MDKRALAVLAVLLTGCETTLFLKLEHHSSMPEYYDRNTTDIFGACFRSTLRENCGDYCPTVMGCINESIHGEPTHGQDPSGEIAFELPVKVWK